MANSVTWRIPLQYKHSRSTHNNQRSDRHSRRNRHRWTNLTIRTNSTCRSCDNRTVNETASGVSHPYRSRLSTVGILFSAGLLWSTPLAAATPTETGPASCVPFGTAQLPPGAPSGGGRVGLENLPLFNGTATPVFHRDPHANNPIQSILGLCARRPRLTRSSAGARRTNGRAMAFRADARMPTWTTGRDITGRRRTRRSRRQRLDLHDGQRLPGPARMELDFRVGCAPVERSQADNFRETGRTGGH